jgi:hypothetical protein
MRDTINKFHPATSWITTALLTLVITTFGIFAQTHASERDTSFAEVSSSISSHALQLLIVCDDTNAVSSKIHYR